MCPTVFDFIFSSQEKQVEFCQLIGGFGLSDYLATDPFPCDNGSFGVTLETLSSRIPGPHGFFDHPSSLDELAAMELAMEAILIRLPDARYF